MTRTERLLALRPQINTAPGALDVEHFQNQTLRPILKFLHPRLLDVWHRHAVRLKGTFYKLNRPEQQDFIIAAFSSQRELRATVFGLCAALFTEVEWLAFRQNEKELLRRIYNLSQQRIMSDEDTYRQALA
jgi:hypothetical protein